MLEPPVTFIAIMTGLLYTIVRFIVQFDENMTARGISSKRDSLTVKIIVTCCMLKSTRGIVEFTGFTKFYEKIKLHYRDYLNFCLE